MDDYRNKNHQVTNQEYLLPEPEEDNCTAATWALLNRVIEFEQAKIIDADGMPDR